MHFKEMHGMDWLGIALAVAVLVLIWLVSKPPWAQVTVAMARTEKVLIWVLILALVVGAWMVFTAGNGRP